MGPATRRWLLMLARDMRDHYDATDHHGEHAEKRALLAAVVGELRLDDDPTTTTTEPPPP